MSVYAIFIRERIRNPSEFAVYAEMATPLLQTLDAEILVAYGPQQALEGPAFEGMEIAEFPSMQAARAFFDSPDYQAAARHRFLGADYRAILVEGLRR